MKLRRGEVRNRTAQRVARMRHAIDETLRPRPGGVRRFPVWDVARVFAVPLRLLISWKPRRGRRAR